jgi:protein ImuB
MGEPIVAIVPVDAPSADLRFAEPIASPEAIATAVTTLMHRLTAELAQRGLGVRLLRLQAARVDGDDQRIVIGTARATRDPRHLLRLIMLKIETIAPGYGLDSLTLVALRCEPLAPQPMSGGIEEGLSTIVDRLAGRLGAAQVYRVGGVESDVPERSVRRVNPLDMPVGWPQPWPRPVRLLAHPEPVDNVLADLPDQPPVRFRWRGRMHRIVRADGPERIYGEWWKRASERAAIRDYFRVEDEDGARFWLFRRGDGEDGRSGDMRWYLHGLFG